MGKRAKKQAFYVYVFLCFMHGIKEKVRFFQNKQIRLTVPIGPIWLVISVFLKVKKYTFFSKIRAKPHFSKKNMIFWFFRKGNKI